ncbi:MAG: rubrerythrin family protein [Halobacteriales archaeon]|nr:rubrerythrin family protein [Halobacteriales archaeon]
MDGEAFVESIETGMATELNRLGSQKLLLALTGADLTEDAVLRVVVADVTAARELYETWAADGTESALVDAVTRAADRERDHFDRLDEVFDIDAESAAERPLIYETLAAYETPVERAGAGLVALPMIRTRTYNQVVGFFINEAAPGPTDLFRTLKAEMETATTDGVELLATLCDDESAWDRARMAAESTITTAYEDYATTLEAMGLDPRPIC